MLDLANYPFLILAISFATFWLSASIGCSIKGRL
jgi:hypothetical protein